MNQKILTPRVIIMMLIFVVIVPFLPLLISRQWDWWEAWVYAIVSILGFVVSRLIVRRRNPDLIAERARYTDQPDAKDWDKILSPLVGLGGGLIPLVIGLDASTAGRNRSDRLSSCSGWLASWPATLWEHMP
jgi:hypothetical protein